MGTLRAWLVFTLTTTHAALIDDLGDFLYDPGTTRDEAREAAHQAGRDQPDRLRTLSPEQLGAFAEQDMARALTPLSPASSTLGTSRACPA